MTQVLVMLVVAIFALTNFVVDILYAWLDPRIRYNR
jgi:peptide/nickel transport system permease protein